MKKFKHLSLLLCLLITLQCLCLPAAAADTTATGETPVWTEAEVLEFGDRPVVMGCRTIEGMIPLAGNDRRLASSQSAFLYETNTETVVYSYNPDGKVHPGNLTKLVTAIVVLEHAAMEEVVTTGVNVTRHGGSVGMQLKVEEELPVKDLLYGMILATGHDAAVALAEHVAGNQQGFVTLMNNWVAKAGCENTSFGSVHGLDTTGYTTARDMVKIVMAARENPAFEDLICAVDYTVGATNRNAERPIYYTGNYMMDTHTIPDFYDGKIKGGLQSYANTSGAHLVCIATNGKEDENGNRVEDPTRMDYVAVILGANRTHDPVDEWKVVNWGNFEEMTDLFKFGFESFKVRRILYEGMALSQFTVSGGESYAVGQSMVNVDSVVPANAHMKNLSMSFEFPEGKQLTAPIKEKEQIGTMTISFGNSVMAEIEVFSMGNVKAADKTGVTIRSTALRSDTEGTGLLAVIGTVCVIVLGLAAAYLAFNAYMRSRMRARRKKRRAQRRRMR